MVVGEQIKVNISVVASQEDKVEWPLLKDTLRREIEIVEQSNIDTLFKDTLSIQNAQILKQSIYITSFDSGVWAVAPLVFKINSIPIESEAFLIDVSTVDIDTTQAIKDIKAPIELPMTLMEWVQKYKWYIVAGGIVLLIIAFFIYLLTRKKEELPFVKPRPQIAPHALAIQKLDTLNELKLWQNGDFKKFHTELSDIIREYLDNHFSITTLESTTDEIELQLQGLLISEAVKKSTIESLRISDLAKFAKAQPLGDENDFCLQTAYQLINDTQALSSTTNENIKEG